MEIPAFELERFLDVYEPGCEVMLAESGVRSLSAGRFDLDVGDLGYVIPTDGSPELRAEIAERYDRDRDEVVLTCGTQEANFLTVAGLLDRGDHTVVVTPTYQSLVSLPAWIGEVTEVRTEPPGWEIDVGAVEAALRPETRLVVLANPSNPTGTYHDRTTLRALYDLVEDANAHLHVDEVYRMLADEPHPPAASLGPRAISTAGVSKAYGLAGARLGWVVADRDHADAVRRWKDYTTISPPIVGQAIARQALGGLEPAILEENRALARANRRRVGSFVERHGLDWAEPTGVVGFPTVPDGFEDASTFCRSLVEAEGVLLAPGGVFGEPGRFRIGFGVETDGLERGLERVDRHIEAAR